MNLTTAELDTFACLATAQRASEIALALKKSQKQVYHTVQSLAAKGLVERSRNAIRPARSTQSSMLLRLLNLHPQLKNVLSGAGIPLFTCVLKPKTVAAIVASTGVKKSTVYSTLRQATSMSIVTKQNNTFAINDALWNDLRAVLEELHRYDMTIDVRVPVGSKIYWKHEHEILFATNREQDAARSAFSAYGDHGIKLLLPIKYYYLPKKILSVREIFLHSLRVAEQESSVRYFTYLALFSLKYRKISGGVAHPILENIKDILNGKHIAGYPTREELRERAKLYDIRLPSNTRPMPRA